MKPRRSPRHQGIPGNEEAIRMAKEGASEPLLGHTAGIPFIVETEFITRYSGPEHQASFDVCNGGRQSKTLMRYPLPSRANELLAMSRLRLGVAVGPVTGHTALRAILYKRGLKERQDCRLCKDDSVDTVFHCPVLACKRHRTWSSTSLRRKDLEKVRVGSLLSLEANTGLGLVV